MVTIRNKISRKIIDKIRMNKEKVLHKDEIIKEMKNYEKIYKKKLNIPSLWVYLRKNRYIKRILGDYYYVYSIEERYNNYLNFSEEELVFLVLQKMKIKFYLGLENALKENKIIWQSLSLTTIINNKFSGIKLFNNSKFKFIKTKEKMFNFGLIKRKTKSNVIYFYSNLEKTYLDILYFSSYKGKKLEDIKIDFKIRKEILSKYLKNYPKKIGIFCSK